MQRVAQAYAKAKSGDRERLLRLIAIHDTALAACVQRDPAPVREALAVLERTLDYSACPELALSLSALYAQARAAVDSGRLDDAGRILATLRSAWVKRMSGATREGRRSS